MIHARGHPQSERHFVVEVTSLRNEPVEVLTARVAAALAIDSQRAAALVSAMPGIVTGLTSEARAERAALRLASVGIEARHRSWPPEPLPVPVAPERVPTPDPEPDLAVEPQPYREAETLPVATRAEVDGIADFADAFGHSRRALTPIPKPPQAPPPGQPTRPVQPLPVQPKPAQPARPAQRVTPVQPLAPSDQDQAESEYDFTAEDALPRRPVVPVTPIDEDPSDYLDDFDDDDAFPLPQAAVRAPEPERVPRAPVPVPVPPAPPVRVSESAPDREMWTLRGDPAATEARPVEVVAPNRPIAHIPNVDERLQRHQAQPRRSRSPLGRLYDRVSTRVVLPSVFAWMIAMVGFWFWWGAIHPDVVLTFTLISAWAVLVGGLIGTLALRPMSREVRRLHDEARRLAEGDLNAPILSERDDELGDLAGALERARLRLQRAVRSAEAEAEREAMDAR